MKVTIAQINTTVGDLVGNTDKMIEIIEANKGKSDLVVFPELTITGYPPLDLVERPGFCEEQLQQLNRIAKASTGIATILGHFRPNAGIGKPFFNSMSLVEDGEIKFTYDKRLLPNYNIFDEWRHFEPGKKVGIYNLKGVNLGFILCEDAWNDKAIADKFIYPINPVQETVEAGADIIISINASPSNVGKPEYRLEKFQAICEAHEIPLIYVNQVGGNDDLVFDGTSFCCDFTMNGKGAQVLVDSFHEDTQIVEYDEEAWTFKKIGGKEVANASHVRDKKSRFYCRQIVMGIKDYARKCGFKKAVIASSGGVDSALVMALAVMALGKENVEAITMPSQVSSEGSWRDSQTLCDNLGIKLHTFNIIKTFETMMDEFAQMTGTDTKSLTKENTQARIRGTILMAFTNQFPEFLPLTTGNKSECAVGYCTIYGDMNGGLAPISDLYKTEVWDLCRFINELHGKEIIPNVIINKEPSAELYEGQKDTNNLPPYPVLDAVLIPYIEGNAIDPKILQECRNIVEAVGFKDFAKIHRMVDRSEFKRRQAAPTIRVHQKAWGFGRRLPIAQNAKPVNALL